MTRAATIAEIQSVMTPAPPSLEQLEQLVQAADKRNRRGLDKLRAAQAEHVASLIALCHAKAARAHFIANQACDEPVML